MNIKEALIWGTKILNKNAKHKASHSDSPILDSEILLCAAIKKPKEFIFAHPEKKLSPPQIKKYKNFISRGAHHEPIAYITGKKEFYGFEFEVNKNVLIPRPETEALIDAVVALAKGGFDKSVKASLCRILDVGTGSGAIAITLKKLFPKARIFASDISLSALALAKKNAKHLGAKIIFKKSNLLQNAQYRILRIKNAIITANLPYLSQKEWQNCQPEIRKYEPRSAFVAGKKGTEIYEKLFKQFGDITTALPSYPPTTLFIEIGYNQKSAITKLAKKILKPKKIEFIKDLTGKWRVVKIVVNSR